MIYVRKWISELEIAKVCSDRYRPELLDKTAMQARGGICKGTFDGKRIVILQSLLLFATQEPESVLS